MNGILSRISNHPELADSQIAKLVGTTKPTIAAIRERTHWNIANINPIDPVALGLCKQSELDLAVQKAAEKRRAEGVMSDDERRALVSTEASLSMDSAEPRIPTAIEGLETFSFGSDTNDQEEEADKFDDTRDADSFFNLPNSSDDEDDDK